jgi:hypothetical protein
MACNNFTLAHHRGNFDYKAALELLDKVWDHDENDEWGTKIAIGDAMVHCYEFVPDLLDDTTTDQDWSGTNTPTNEHRMTPVSIIEENMIDASSETVYFEEVYKDWPVHAT